MSENEYQIDADKIDALLERPCWVVDPLPFQVPADSGGQYFAIEQYCLNGSIGGALLTKHRNILLGLNCYYDLYVAEADCVKWTRNPSPEVLADLVCKKSKYLNILLPDDTLIVLSDHDMSVYNPDTKTLELICLLAGAAGLFVWQAPES